MTHIRIELHLTPKETKALDKIAKQQGRSRKNLCETEIRKLIQSFDKVVVAVGCLVIVLKTIFNS